MKWAGEITNLYKKFKLSFKLPYYNIPFLAFLLLPTWNILSESLRWKNKEQIQNLKLHVYSYLGAALCFFV